MMCTGLLAGPAGDRAQEAEGNNVNIRTKEERNVCKKASGEVREWCSHELIREQTENDRVWRCSCSDSKGRGDERQEDNKCNAENRSVLCVRLWLCSSR